MPNPIIKPVPSSDSSEQVVTPAAAAHADMRPATPLPWLTHTYDEGTRDEEHYITGVAKSVRGDPRVKQNFAYAVHAANAYPRLVGLLKRIHETEEGVIVTGLERTAEVCERISKEIDREREAEYLNETATDRFESRGWPLSVTLDCDCHVTRTQLSGERKWDLCPTHEGLNP